MVTPNRIFNAKATNKPLAKLATRSGKKIWVINGDTGWEFTGTDSNLVFDIEHWMHGGMIHNNKVVTLKDAFICIEGNHYPISNNGMILHNQKS